MSDLHKHNGEAEDAQNLIVRFQRVLQFTGKGFFGTIRVKHQSGARFALAFTGMHMQSAVAMVEEAARFVAHEDAARAGAVGHENELGAKAHFQGMDSKTGVDVGDAAVGAKVE